MPHDKRKKAKRAPRVMTQSPERALDTDRPKTWPRPMDKSALERYVDGLDTQNLETRSTADVKQLFDALRSYLLLVVPFIWPSSDAQREFMRKLFNDVVTRYNQQEFLRQSLIVFLPGEKDGSFFPQAGEDKTRDATHNLRQFWYNLALIGQQFPPEFKFANRDILHLRQALEQVQHEAYLMVRKDRKYPIIPPGLRALTIERWDLGDPVAIRTIVPPERLWPADMTQAFVDDMKILTQRIRDSEEAARLEGMSAIAAGELLKEQREQWEHEMKEEAERVCREKRKQLFGM